jgi:hypothetical protein
VTTSKKPAGQGYFAGADHAPRVVAAKQAGHHAGRVIVGRLPLEHKAARPAVVIPFAALSNKNQK